MSIPKEESNLQVESGKEQIENSDNNSVQENQLMANYQPELIEKLDKQDILKYDFNLNNLVRSLKSILNNLHFLKDQEVVLTLGQTGSGKSTLLTSLVFGKEALCQKKVTEINP